MDAHRWAASRKQLVDPTAPLFLRSGHHLFMGFVELALAIFAGTISTAGFLTLLRAGWLRTVGRRRQARDLVERIAPGLSLTYVQNVLGPPRTTKETEGWTEFVWIDRLYYVQVCSRSGSDRAERIAVTSRHRRFQPRVDLGAAKVRLHKSTFADTFDGGGVFTVGVGARRFVATETKYLANPGSYLTLTVAVSDAAQSRHMEIPSGEDVRSGSFEPGALPEELRRFRSATTVNTYSISGPMSSDKGDPFMVGADLDSVRHLPTG